MQITINEQGYQQALELINKGWRIIYASFGVVILQSPIKK